MGSLNALYRKHKDEAAFFLVYIREAHAEDGMKAADNEKEGIRVFEPTTLEERSQVAATCVSRLAVEMPVLVDTLDNRTESGYAAWPDRLYLVGENGEVSYKGPPGPGGFDVSELTTALERILRRHEGPLAGAPHGALRSVRARG